MTEEDIKNSKPLTQEGIDDIVNSIKEYHEIERERREQIKEVTVGDWEDLVEIVDKLRGMLNI